MLHERRTDLLTWPLLSPALELLDPGYDIWHLDTSICAKLQIGTSVTRASYPLHVNLVKQRSIMTSALSAREGL